MDCARRPVRGPNLGGTTGRTGGTVPRQPTSRLQVSGYRFLLRRIECALLRRDIHTVNEPLRAHTASLAVGCGLATVPLAGGGFLAVLGPRPALGLAQSVMGRVLGM